MDLTRDTATEKAREDLAKRISTDTGSISILSVEDKDFPDMSLGAPVNGEGSAQMISTGWEIKLGAEGNVYEYRADKYQLRLFDWRGMNHLVELDKG
jgi:hypothetical protein